MMEARALLKIKKAMNNNIREVMDGKVPSFPNIFMLIMEEFRDRITVQEAYEIAKSVNAKIGKFHGMLDVIVQFPRLSVEHIREMEKLKNAVLREVEMEL